MLRHLQTSGFSRTFASAAAPQTATVTSNTLSGPLTAIPSTLAESRTESGVKCLTLDTHAPLSALALVLPLGPTAEVGESRGAAHFLKNSVFKSNEIFSQLAITRLAELRYSPLSVSLSHDSLTISAEFYRDKLPEILALFASIVENQKVFNHEFGQVKEMCDFEREQSNYCARTKLLDCLYSTAYRGSPLSHSLYASQLSDIHSMDQILQFKAKGLVNAGKDKIALVGVGISHEKLKFFEKELFASSLSAFKGTPTNIKQSVYTGGEMQLELHNQFNHFALAFHGKYTKSQLSVLAALLGNGENTIKYSKGSSLISNFREQSKAVSVQPFGIAEHGLFGIKVAANGHLQPILNQLHSFLTSLTAPTAESLASAKNRAKFNLLAADSRTAMLEDMCSTALRSDSYTSLKDQASGIDSVTINDVTSMTSGLFSSSKPTLVSVGRLYELPFLNN